MNLKLLDYYYFGLKTGIKNEPIIMGTVIRSGKLKYFERFAVLNSVYIRQESNTLSPNKEVIQGVRKLLCGCYLMWF
jgi:hypothetical protein